LREDHNYSSRLSQSLLSLLAITIRVLAYSDQEDYWIGHPHRHGFLRRIDVEGL
jgi:hypothetical protein